MSCCHFLDGLQSNTTQYDWVQSILSITRSKDGSTNEGDIKATVSPDIQDAGQDQSLKNMKSSLMIAYKEVRLNNRKAHQKNKAYYDKKGKERKFEVNGKVYLFCRHKLGCSDKEVSLWGRIFLI